jgi:hypothetical protein
MVRGQLLLGSDSASPLLCLPVSLGPSVCIFDSVSLSVPLSILCICSGTLGGWCRHRPWLGGWSWTLQPGAVWTLGARLSLHTQGPPPWQFRERRAWSQNTWLWIPDRHNPAWGLRHLASV